MLGLKASLLVFPYERCLHEILFKLQKMDEIFLVFAPIGFFLQIYWSGTLQFKMKGYTYKTVLSKLIIS